MHSRQLGPGMKKISVLGITGYHLVHFAVQIQGKKKEIKQVKKDIKDVKADYKATKTAKART